MKTIWIIRIGFAIAFFGSIGAGYLLGMGDLNKIDTAGDWVAIFGAGLSGLVFAVYSAFKN